MNSVVQSDKKKKSGDQKVIAPHPLVSLYVSARFYGNPPK